MADIETLTEDGMRAFSVSVAKAIRIIGAQAEALARVRALRDEHSRQANGSVFSMSLVEYLDKALDGAPVANGDVYRESAEDCMRVLQRDLAVANARIAELELEAKDHETDIDKWVAAESTANARIAELEHKLDGLEARAEAAEDHLDTEREREKTP
jgi:hypothetical protein